MNMVMNLIAILLSLAMSLTGVGGEGQPAAAARNLVLRNISVSYNGEALRLGHQASLGVSTDGERAVFDFGVDLDGERLLPVQLGVSQEGVTALLGNSDVAVTVTAKAIEAVTEQLNAQLEGAMGEAENPEVLKFITDDFMPAYAAMLGAAADPDARQRVSAACQAVFDETVDRGEGTPGSVEVDDDEYAVTIYTYTLDSAKMAELLDTLYGADPVLEDYYDAIFKLYAMLPEESGLTGLSSFADMFEKLGLDMTMDISEQLSDDGQVDVTDAVLTLDMSGMVQAMAQAEPVVEAFGEEVETETEEAETATEEAGDEADGEAVEEAEPEGDAPDEIEPLVMNIHSVKLGDMNEAQVTCAYDVDESHGFEMEAQSAGESDAQEMEMTMTFLENGEKVDRCKLSAFIARDEEGGSSYSLSVRNIQQDVARFDAGFYGLATAEGTSENSFTFAFRNEDVNVDVSFDLDVTADEIEDAANGREDAYVIDDLSEAGIQALSEDQDFAALMMKAVTSLTADAGKLTQDRDLQNLLTLIKGERLPIDVDDIDREDAAATYDISGDDLSYVIDGEGDPDVEYEFEDVEDDGVLGYEEPSFTWLPDGWKVASSESDTAYDWVEMFITDEANEDRAYAIFFPDNEEETTDYIVQENGGILEGRKISVANYGEGSLSVTLREAGLYCEMMFASDAIDEDTLGKIIAGIQFPEE